MAKTSKKHEPVLLPESGRNQPTRWPLLWFGLLLFGVVASFWRDAVYDEDAVRKHNTEIQEKIERQQLENLRIQKEMTKRPVTGKGK